jgi:hypothetical protein
MRWVGGLFGLRGGDIGTVRVDIHGPRLWNDHQIHVFHWNGTEEGLIPLHQGTREAHAILEADFDGADLGYKLSAAVGQDYLLLVNFLQLQLNLDMGWNAEMDGPGIGERFCLDRC